MIAEIGKRYHARNGKVVEVYAPSAVAGRLMGQWLEDGGFSAAEFVAADATSLAGTDFDLISVIT